ncbi:MAG: hypothetical protein HQL46_10585 [Gammaproteobacteria bacterium]|nr:hypothetical protein [Gammaproteobacteria bacterium]
MKQKHQLLINRFSRLKNHYTALKDYKQLIDELLTQNDFYQVSEFNKLLPQDKAILDAYLKRLASLQDFLGAKIFSLLLDISGISYTAMTEVLYAIEKEKIIDSLGNWIDLREVRNELEHDYPEDLESALKDLKFCIDNFSKLESYYLNSLNFAKKYIHETF